MDAAQAEKMREREAMESVKLLYHDNMIEMTSVSSSSSWGILAQGHNTLHDSEVEGVIIYVVLTFKNYHISLSFITTNTSYYIIYHKHLSISEKHERRCYVVLFLYVVD